jgi:hypothetical protein
MRDQPTLHDAMVKILSSRSSKTATLEELCDENIRLDLYRQEKGAGKHPEPGQFRIRAVKRPTLFKFVDSKTIRYIGD